MLTVGRDTLGDTHIGTLPLPFGSMQSPYAPMLQILLPMPPMVSPRHPNQPGGLRVCLGQKNEVVGVLQQPKMTLTGLEPATSRFQ